MLGAVLAVALLGATPENANALGDITPPTSDAAPPAFATGPSVAIPYTAADEEGGSGVARVDLYVKAPRDATFPLTPTDSDTTPDTPSFTYVPGAGDGDYAFYTVAVDNDGNEELPPPFPDGVTTIDGTPPSPTASAPSTARAGPVAITYSADDGSGTGVSSVELWVEAPGDSSYSLADTDNSPASPSFSYSPAGGDGTYSFYTV